MCLKPLKRDTFLFSFRVRVLSLFSDVCALSLKERQILVLFSAFLLSLDIFALGLLRERERERNIGSLCNVRVLSLSSESIFSSFGRLKSFDDSLPRESSSLSRGFRELESAERLKVQRE